MPKDSTPLRVGVVGLGNMSRYHARTDAAHVTERVEAERQLEATASVEP